MPVKTESHFDDLRRYLRQATPETLEDIGDMVDQTIYQECPKRSGKMAAAGRHEVRGKTLRFINDAVNAKGVCYSVFVHLGTYKMSSNPWIMRAIHLDQEKIAERLVEGLTP